MVKDFIKRIPFIQWINEKRRQKIIQENCLLLQREGLNSLAAYYRVGEALGIHFDVMFGTLLGVYRDHGFITHDDDIDMICNIKYLSQNLLNKLKQEGFIIDRVFVSSDRKGVQLPMKYKGLMSDIYFYYEDNSDNRKHIYIPMALESKDWRFSEEKNIFRVKDMHIPSTNNRMKVPFMNTEIEIVANADDVLKALYGESYMVPKANAHANPPVRYFDLGEKYYTYYPIDIFESSGILNYINRE